MQNYKLAQERMRHYEAEASQNRLVKAAKAGIPATKSANEKSKLSNLLTLWKRTKRPATATMPENPICILPEIRRMELIRQEWEV